MNFYVGEFYKPLLIRFTYGEDPTTIAFTLGEDLHNFMLIFRHFQDKFKTCSTAKEAKETVKDMYRILQPRGCDLHARNEEKSPNESLICCIFIF